MRGSKSMTAWFAVLSATALGLVIPGVTRNLLFDGVGRLARALK
jgi:hypothetical protein